jgi:integrase
MQSQKVQIRDYTFYAERQYHKALESLELVLGLNLQFSGRHELAEAIVSAIKVNLNLIDKYKDSVNALNSAINCVLDDTKGKPLRKLKSDRRGILYGQIGQFKLAAGLITQPQKATADQAKFLRALLLNAVIHQPSKDYSTVSDNIRKFFTGHFQPDNIISLIPTSVSDVRGFARLIEELSTRAQLCKDTKNKNFCNALRTLLKDLRLLQKTTLRNGSSIASKAGPIKYENIPHELLSQKPIELPTIGTVIQTEGVKLIPEMASVTDEENELSRGWIRNVQNRVPGDYRALLQKEKQHFLGITLNAIASKDIEQRDAAGLLLLIYVTGQERERVLQFTFGEGKDIQPDGTYRRDITPPENAFVQNNPDVEMLQRVEFVYLNLPPVLVKWLKNLNPNSSTILHGLGITQKQAESSIANLLERIREKHDCNRIRFEKIQTALQHQLTLQWRDESLTHLLVGKLTHDHPSLSYYVVREVSSIQRAYDLTVNVLLNESDRSYLGPLASSSFTNDSIVSNFYPTRSEIESLQKNASQTLDIAKESGDIFEIHNAYTNYCLLLMFFATGHRPVLDPFPKFSHFDLESGTVLISDKTLSHKNAWRLVALPELAIKQILHYKKYLNALPAKLCATQEHQELGRKLAPHNLDEEKGIPLFFYFNKDAKDPIESISQKSLKQHWGLLWEWPANFLRHILATELVKKNTSVELVKIQLGHIYSNEHPFGMRSHLTVSGVLGTLSKSIDSILASFGWVPMLSPMRNTHSHEDSKVQKLRKRRFGYEVRQKHRRIKKIRAQDVLKNIAFKLFEKEDLKWLTADELVKIENIVDAQEHKKSLKHACKTQLKNYRNLLKKKTSFRLQPEASPFKENTLRLQKKAKDIISIWFKYLNSADICEHNFQERRLAEITISAALCGGLLLPNLLENLNIAIIGKLYKVEDDLVIDFSDYAFTSKNSYLWYPDSLTKLLILGFINNCKGKIRAPNRKKYDNYLTSILKELRLNTEQPYEALRKVGKSLTILKLPMVLHQYATGDVRSASLPLRTLVRLSTSERLISTQDVNVNIQKGGIYWMPPIKGYKNASTLSVFRKRYKSYKKSIQELPKVANREINKRYKNKLKRLVSQDFSANDTFCIASILLSAFLIFLCEEGTENQTEPAYNTVNDYAGYILRLFEGSAETLVFINWDHESLESFYVHGLKNTTEQERSKAGVSFKRFHFMLIEKYGFDDVDWSVIYALADCKFEEVKVDANCVSEYEYLMTLDLVIKSNVVKNEYKEQIALMTLLGFRGGMRNNEAHGILSRDILISDIIEMIIKPNHNRPLKSDASKRCVRVLEALSEMEVVIINRWQKLLSSENKPDVLASALTCYSWDQRDVIDRGEATRIIHTCLRLVTGDSSLRFHHFRHSKATRDIRQVFDSKSKNKDTDFTENLYPLHGIATEIGHTDVLTTLRSYTHCLDQVLSRYLSNSALFLNNFGVSYCLKKPYSVIRKRKLQNGELHSSLNQNRSIANLIPSPNYLTKPYNLQNLIGHTQQISQDFTLEKIEYLLFRYIYSPLSFAEFASLHNVNEEQMKLLFNVAKKVEHESGFDRYSIKNAHDFNSSEDNTKCRQASIFSVNEIDKIHRAILNFPDLFAKTSLNVEDLKKTLELWVNSYYPKNSSNIITHQDDFALLNNLILELFDGTPAFLYFEDRNSRWANLNSIPNNIFLNRQPVPKAHTKIKGLQLRRAEFRIKGTLNRKLVNRMLFLLSIYYRLHK